MSQTRRALAVVAGPYRFYQVLWLYTQFADLEWSILLLPYGNDDKVRRDIHKKCETLGIFHEIYDSNMIGQDSSMWNQFRMFLKMLFFFLVGKRKALMKQIIQSQTQKSEFDVFFVGCEYSIIEGAIIGLADEKEVYIFEEGLSDYVLRKKLPGLNLKEIISFIVTKMGYFSPYECFELYKASLCIKYASIPQLLNHRNYKQIYKLFESTDEKFDKLVKKAYNIDLDMLKKYDAILFTTVLEDYDTEESIHYMEAIQRWIGEHYKGKDILIKRHPRDRMQYVWQELDSQVWGDNIPAEVIMSMAQHQDILIMGMSTAIITTMYNKQKLIIFERKHTNRKEKMQVKYMKGLLEIPDENMVYI